MPSIVWKGHLTFGLVSIPVKLFRAARRERVRLHYVHRPQVEEPPSEAPMMNPPGLAERPLARTPQTLDTTPPATAPVSRVRQALVTSAGEEPITRAEVLKGYEVEPDHYVVLDPEELKGL